MSESDCGIRSVKRAPFPGSDSTVTEPPRPVTRLRTTSRPTPRPLVSPACSRVEKPGVKMRSSAAREDRLAACCSPMIPFLQGGGADLLRGDAAAVVLDGDGEQVAVRARGEHDLADARLAGRGALLGRLDPVVDAVADEVDERVVEREQDRLVHAGLAAADDALDLLALLARHVARGAGEAGEHAGERDEPGVPDPLREHPELRLRGGGGLGLRAGEPEGVGAEQVDVPLDLLERASSRACRAAARRAR